MKSYYIKDRKGLFIAASDLESRFIVEPVAMETLGASALTP